MANKKNQKRETVENETFDIQRGGVQRRAGKRCCLYIIIESA